MMASLNLRKGLLLFHQSEKWVYRFLSSSAGGVAKRTQEANPGAHNYDQIGLYYKLDDSLKKKLFGLGGIPKSFAVNLETFGETCFMVRQPALDIITMLKKTDYSKPVIRYLLFGKPGCGKSVSLAHVLHYAYLNEFIIVHVPWVWNWMRNERHEVTEAWRPGRATSEEETETLNLTSDPSSSVRPSKDKLMVDLPLVAAAWLKHFQLQNSDLLSKLKLEVNEEYVWSQREVTPIGTPLTDLVSHGINRVKYACTVVQALINQLKHNANNDRCRVMVATDGINAFFGDKTNLKRDDRSPVLPEHITLTSSFLEATTNDWRNGAVIVTVDQLSGPHNTLNSHYPIYLLGRKGFEHLDPFVSVQVKELTPKEVESMLDYYEDRKWIQRKGGRHELSFISNSNPFQLMNLCAPL